MRFINIFMVILSSLFKNSFQESQIDLRNSKVWGPGLEPQVLILPARYIFLQIYLNDYKLNESHASPIDFKVLGKSLQGDHQCRVWANVLDRKDGSYILRYKLYEPCKNPEINIRLENKHIGKSPFKIEGIIYPENCQCARMDIYKWVQNVQCGDIPTQILSDLHIFKKIDWDKMRDKVINKYDNPNAVSICHYVIKNNEIYRKCYGKYVGFKMFMDSILLSLMRKMRFPDTEFFINLGDWPLIKDHTSIFPVFSWCGSTDSYDIVLPTYDITESTLENMGRVMLDMLSVQGNTEEEWENRIPKAFWRGRDSNKERLKLIDISRENPHLFNVSLTNFFFYRDQQDKYGPKSEHVSFYKFFDYKYQISIDGTVAAYRLPYLLAGGSLLLKQNSKYYEHFYNDLQPNVHYIPIENNLSDLQDKLKWALNQDLKAKLIAKNANNFANENLLPKDIFCYHAYLFGEFSKLLISKVNVIEGMEKVPQPAEAMKCKCEELIHNEL